MAAAILPFLPLIGQAVGQGIQAIGGSRRAKDMKEFYGDLRESGEKDAKRLQAERQGLYSMGPTMRRYMQYAMQDPAADLERQEAQRQAGTAVGALKAGGARAILGGLGAQQQQAASNMARIAADSYRRRQDATAAVARQEERLRQEQRGDIGADLNLAREQAASGLAGEFESDLYRRALGTNFLTSLVGLTGQAAGMGLFGKGGKKGGQSNSDTLAELAESGEGDQILSGIESYITDPTMNPFRINENGGKVKKTPGEFSHATNPINVMQDGAKIGELTGGEYVLNPEQAAAIARQSDIARKLFRKFDREA